MTDWNDPIPKHSCADTIEILTEEDIRDAVRTLKEKARYHRQYAAVLETIIDELEGDMDA